MSLTPIKLLRGDVLGKLVESFAGFADLGGGGGAAEQGDYDGNAVSIPNGGGGLPLTWDTLSEGTALLDLADPANPKLLEVGTYALTLNAHCATPLTAGGSADLAVFVPTMNLFRSASIPRCTTPEFGFPTLTIVWTAAAGDLGNPINAVVTNRDGVATRDYLLDPSLLVKLS